MLQFLHRSFHSTLHISHTLVTSHAARHTSTMAGEANCTFIHGICVSQAPWYNIMLASSLFPSQLPPLPKHAASNAAGPAHIREDRNFAFDGGSSACAVIAAVCFMFECEMTFFGVSLISCRILLPAY